MRAILVLAVATATLTHCARQPSSEVLAVPPEAISAAATESPLDGAWELSLSRAYRGDSLIADYRPPRLRSLKVLAGGRFSFVTERDDGTLAQASAGRFTAANGTYVEHVELSAAPRRRGQSYSFSYRLEGSTWFHRGLVGDLRFEEEWRRATP